jgi:hypothetical protein
VRWTSPAAGPGSAPTSTPHPPHPTRRPTATQSTTGTSTCHRSSSKTCSGTLDPTDPLFDGAFTDSSASDDTEPDHTDHVLAALLDDLTRWTLDLDDSYAWSVPAPVE